MLHSTTFVRRIAHLPKLSMSVLVNAAHCHIPFLAYQKEGFVKDEWGAEEKEAWWCGGRVISVFNYRTRDVLL
jgi:hypothetical protein